LCRKRRLNGAVLRIRPEKPSPYVCFESHEQLFSYLATVTITDDRAANLDLCLALTAYRSEGYFEYHTRLLQHGTSVFKVIYERPVTLTSECRPLGEGAIYIYFKSFRFAAAGTSGARTHDIPFAKRERYHLATTIGLSI
jgi:hypothetical protein